MRIAECGLRIADCGSEDESMGRLGVSCAVAVIVAATSTYVASGFSRTGAAAQAKPEMQRLPQFDNDRAVSWRSVIPPHTESTLHRHDRYRSIVAIVGGDLRT